MKLVDGVGVAVSEIVVIIISKDCSIFIYVITSIILYCIVCILWSECFTLFLLIA